MRRVVEPSTPVSDLLIGCSSSEPQARDDAHEDNNKQTKNKKKLTERNILVLFKHENNLTVF